MLHETHIHIFKLMDFTYLIVINNSHFPRCTHWSLKCGVTHYNIPFSQTHAGSTQHVNIKHGLTNIRTRCLSTPVVRKFRLIKPTIDSQIYQTFRQTSDYLNRRPFLTTAGLNSRNCLISRNKVRLIHKFLLFQPIPVQANRK